MTQKGQNSWQEVKHATLHADIPQAYKTKIQSEKKKKKKKTCD